MKNLVLLLIPLLVQNDLLVVTNFESTPSKFVRGRSFLFHGGFYDRSHSEIDTANQYAPFSPKIFHSLSFIMDKRNKKNIRTG